MSDFTEAQLKKIEQAKKLLNLAANNPSESEAASAAAKANEILLELNLDVATIENAGAAKDGKREQLKVEGGFFKHQRRLWYYVAELNFCIYWTQEYTITGRIRRNSRMIEGTQKKKRHVLVGRIVNTQATRTMADYLTQAIDRILLARLHGNTSQMYSDWAAGYRKGATERVIEMLTEKREAYLVQEKLKQQAAEKAARESGRVTTNTAITVAVYQDAEHDANIDFLYGDGTSAKRAAARAKAAAERAAEEKAYTEWAKANPEEAAAQAALHKTQRRKSGGRRSSGWSRERINSSGYYAGYDEAAEISLDQQVGDSVSVRKIAGR